MADLIAPDEPAATPGTAAPAAAPAAAAPAPTAPPAAGGAPAPAAATQTPVADPADENPLLKSLPDDLKKAPSLARYSSTEALARSYISLERTLGSDKVPVPKDENDTEAWDRYYKAGGRPEEPTQYQVNKPEKLPEGVVWDQGMEDWWRHAAFEGGLSQRQFSRFVDVYRDRFLSQMEAQNKQDKLSETQAKMILKRDWGNEYEARRGLVNAEFASMPEAVQREVLAKGLNRNPDYLKYLHDVRARVTGQREPRPAGDVVDNSPEAAQRRIADHRARYDAALRDVSHPEHDLRTAELTELFQKAFPVTEAA